MSALLSGLAPAVEGLLQAAPALAGGLTVATWVIWGLGSALLVLLGAACTCSLRCGATAVAAPVPSPARRLPHKGKEPRGGQQHIQRAVHPGHQCPDRAAGGQHPTDPAGSADHAWVSLLLLLAFTFDGNLSFLEGGWLFALLAAYTVLLVVQSRRQTQAAKDAAASGCFRQI